MKREELFNYRKLTDDELNSYQDDGFLVIKGVLKQEGIAQMQEECMTAWAKEKEGFDPNKSWLQNSLLVNIHHQAPTVRDYYFDGPLVNIATQIIGPNVKGATSQLTFKMKGNTKPFGWHQDNGYGELEHSRSADWGGVRMRDHPSMARQDRNGHVFFRFDERDLCHHRRPSSFYSDRQLT